MMTVERRTVLLSDGIVTRASAVSKGSSLGGRGLVYGSLSEDLGGFRERFAPGSARLADDVLILHGHDTRAVLGRTSAGTARVWADGQGVGFEAFPPDTQWARDLTVSMQRGDVRQCSFAFRVIEDQYVYERAAGCVVRTIYAAEILELSITASPAYTATEASATQA